MMLNRVFLTRNFDTFRAAVMVFGQRQYMAISNTLNRTKEQWNAFSDIWREAAQQEQEQPDKRQRTAHELAFLPAGLEIIETPPSPTARLVYGTIILIFIIAMIWGYFGKVDVVITANGQLIPSGQSKVIQSLEHAVIRSIDVEEGQLVEPNQTLVRLDPTESTADRNSLWAQLSQARATAAQLQALTKNPDDPLSVYVEPESMDVIQLTEQRLLLQAKADARRSQMATMDGRIRELEAELLTATAIKTKLEATLPLLRERAKSRRQLAQKGLAPRLAALEQEQAVVDVEQDIIVQDARIESIHEKIDGARVQREQLVNEYMANNRQQLSELQVQIDQLVQELVKVTERLDRRYLSSPIKGYVQQLSVSTVGGVVSPAQPIMKIVPRDAVLQAEALLQNRDRANIQVGDVVEVKVEAFPFVEYGTIPATITNISRDAVQDEQRGAVFKVQAELARDHFQYRGEKVTLSSGLNVVLEIKAKERRVISFLFNPLLKGLSEAGREL